MTSRGQAEPVPRIDRTDVNKAHVFVRMDGRFFPGILVLVSVPLCVCQTYYLSDKAGLGRVFDGVGGLSGGGVRALHFRVEKSPRRRAARALLLSLLLPGNVAAPGQLRGAIPEPDIGLPVQGAVQLAGGGGCLGQKS